MKLMPQLNRRSEPKTGKVWWWIGPVLGAGLALLGVQWMPQSMELQQLAGVMLFAIGFSLAVIGVVNKDK